MRRILAFRHGIRINRYFMLGMERYFTRRGWEVRNPTYPTTRLLVEENARELADELMAIHHELEARGEPHEFYAVTHSMGGLVLRYALTHFEMPPFKRAVLFVPPNNGSATARYFRDWKLYRWIFGKSAASQLAQDPPGIYAEAGIPEGVDIGIIAGDVPWRLWPVPLSRPNDGVVTLEEARLPPFPLKVLPYGHTPILFCRYAWEVAEAFLETGKFLDGESREREASHV